METSHILFQIEARSFDYTDGYDGLSTENIQILYGQLQEATASLEGELRQRQPERLSNQPHELSNSCDRLRSTARSIKTSKSLDVKETQRVDLALNFLCKPQSTPSAKRYQTFLTDVLRIGSPGLVLLCAVALGKSTLMDMGSKGRESVLRYLKTARRSLESPHLEALANDVGMPSADDPALVKKLDRPDKRRIVGSESATVDTELLQRSRSEGNVGLNPKPDEEDLTGRVYYLKTEDVQRIAATDQIQGQIRMTIPYQGVCVPFVTIPVSYPLSLRYARESEREM